MPILLKSAALPALAALGALVLGACAESRPLIIANARLDEHGPLAVEIRELLELGDGRQELISVVAPISAQDGSFSAHLETQDVTVEMSGKAQSGLPPTSYGGIYAYKRVWISKPSQGAGAPAMKDSDDLHGGLQCSVGESQTIGERSNSGTVAPGGIRSSRILLRIGHSFPLP
jgi:hypothetical protein